MSISINASVKIQMDSWQIQSIITSVKTDVRADDN